MSRNMLWLNPVEMESKLHSLSTNGPLPSVTCNNLYPHGGAWLYVHYNWRRDQSGTAWKQISATLLTLSWELQCDCLQSFIGATTDEPCLLSWLDTRHVTVTSSILEIQGRWYAREARCSKHLPPVIPDYLIATNMAWDHQRGRGKPKI